MPTCRRHAEKIFWEAEGSLEPNDVLSPYCFVPVLSHFYRSGEPLTAPVGTPDFTSFTSGSAISCLPNGGTM